MVSTTFSLVITAILLYLAYRYQKYRSQVNRIPGPKIASWLLGNLDHFFKPKNKDKYEYVKQFFARFGTYFERFRSEGVFRLWMGPFNAIYVLTNAAAVENLLKSHINVNKGTEYRFLSPFLGDGLLMAESSTWRQRRKLLVTGFHVKILQDFLPIFKTHTNILISKIESKFDQITKIAIVKDIRPLFEDLTLDIVKETSFGIDATKDTAVNESYRNALKSAFYGASDRIRTPHYWIDLIYKLSKSGQKFYKSVNFLQGYAEEVIKKRRKLLFKAKGKFLKPEVNQTNCDINNNDSGIEEEGGSSTFSTTTSIHKTLTGRIIIDILLQKQATQKTLPNSSLTITDKTIKADVNTFILGGHDTTAEALTFATLLIAHHPQVQAKVYAELVDVFGEGEEDVENFGNLKITFNSLRNLRYLEQTIKEAFRLWPSIQVIGRRLTEKLTLQNGTTLPPGSAVYICPQLLHQDPTFFPDPTTFNPDRFGPEEGEKLSNPYAYIPFSAGPRACIGQRYAMLELKYVLASLFLKYKVRSITFPDEVIRIIAPILKPMGAISLAFERR